MSGSLERMIGKTISDERERKRPDIVFAYANVFGAINEKDGKFLTMPDRAILSPDEMFERITQECRQKRKKLIIQKKTLNHISFDHILNDKPKVLFIMCHGDMKVVNGQEKTHFCFERQDQPWLMDNCDEQRIMYMLKGIRKIEVGVIVLSTCHSCKLGEVLRNCGAPAVIAISTTDQVLQKSTFTFN